GFYFSRARSPFPTRRSSDLEDPVEPALEDRRHRVPPQRELEDDRVRPEQLLLLGADVRGEGPGVEGPPRVGGDTQRARRGRAERSEEHTSELQSRENLVCRL